YAAVLPDQDLPARGKSHPINFLYGSRRNFRDGSRRLRWNSFFSAAVLANAATCSSVCLLSFGRAIHSRMIFRRVSWSSMFAVPWLISHLRPPRPERDVKSARQPINSFPGRNLGAFASD